jgi:colicin import membrane protein
MKNKVSAIKALMVGLCVFSFTAQAQTGSQKNELSGVTQMNIISDSETDGVKMISMQKDGQSYKIVLVNGKIDQLLIDGKKVPESEFSRYNSLVSSILEQIKRDQEQAEKDRARAEIDRKQAEKDRERAEQDRLQAQKDRDRAEQDRLQSQKDRERAEKDRENAQLDRVQAEKDRARAELDRKQAEIDRKKAEEDRKLLEALVDELITDKLLDSRHDDFEVELTNDALIVNENKQPESLHQKYKSKFLKQGGSIKLTKNGSTRNMRINKN